MTKEELEKEAKAECFMLTVNTIGIDQRDVELAYVMGAEPREKRIAELEAEVKEWKDKADLWCKTANLKDHNIMINKELEKENAELKEELKDANKKVVHLACNQNKDLKRKINKAKEIIKNLMVFAEMDDREYEKEYKEAEQFLKESE